MAVSFVLRLSGDALMQRRIVGQVEVVQTGELVKVRDAKELIGFLYDRGESPRERFADSDRARGAR